MKVLSNPIVFFVGYVVLMVPTYILPYLGSNSAIVWTTLLKNGAFTEVPFFFLHAGVMLLLVALTWVRGRAIEKSWLVVFPVLALIFDFTPVLSAIPLVPTVLHLMVLVLGVRGAAPEAAAGTEPA